MLVECPRCHFKQPQDQYCASCGVDMLAFKPKEEPALDKILRSGIFQFLMVVLLGVGVTYFVIQADQPQQWIQKINRFSSFKANINPANRSTEAGIPEDTANDQANFEAPPPPTWSARGGVAENSSAVASETDVITLGEGEAGVSDTVRVTINMIEIDSDYMNTLYQQVQNDGSGYENEGIKVLKLNAVNLGSARTLKTTTVILAKQFIKNVKFGSINYGLDIQLTYQETQGERVALNAAVTKMDGNNDITVGSESLLAKTGRVIFFGSALLSYLETHSELAGIPPFQIFQSPDFRSQKTTFAIVIGLE